VYLRSNASVAGAAAQQAGVATSCGAWHLPQQQTQFPTTAFPSSIGWGGRLLCCLFLTAFGRTISQLWRGGGVPLHGVMRKSTHSAAEVDEGLGNHRLLFFVQSLSYHVGGRGCRCVQGEDSHSIMGCLPAGVGCTLLCIHGDQPWQQHTNPCHFAQCRNSSA